MTELDPTVRAAIDAAAARAVAPPFAEVRRRHARARTRRVATASAAALAAVATAAVALPRSSDVGPAGPKPYAELSNDPDALRRIAGCLRGTPLPEGATPGSVYYVPDDRSMRCFTDNGYQTPPVSTRSGSPAPDPQLPAEDSGWYVCAEPPATTPRATIGSGTVPGGRRWRVVAWEGRDGARCVSWRTDPPVEFALHSDADDDTGPPGALRPRLRWDTLGQGTPDPYVVIWGALDPEVATVRIQASTGTYDAPVVRLPGMPDRVYVGYVFRNAGRDLAWRYTLLDARGRELPKPSP